VRREALGLASLGAILLLLAVRLLLARDTVPETVLVVGDSLAQGYHQRVPWPTRLKREGVRSVSLCTHVALTSPEIVRMARNRVHGRYEAAVILCGTNDARDGVPPKRYEQALETLVGMLPATRILILGQPPDLRRPRVDGRPYRAVAGRVAARHDCGYLDLARLLGSDPETYPDRVHPSDQAAERMAKAVVRALQHCPRRDVAGRPPGYALRPMGIMQTPAWRAEGAPASR